MRTALTLDADVVELLERDCRRRGVGLSAAANDAIRAGLGPSLGRRQSLLLRTDMGGTGVNLDRSLQLAGRLEDDEIVRRLGEGR